MLNIFYKKLWTTCQSCFMCPWFLFSNGFHFHSLSSWYMLTKPKGGVYKQIHLQNYKQWWWTPSITKTNKDPTRFSRLQRHSKPKAKTNLLSLRFLLSFLPRLFLLCLSIFFSSSSLILFPIQNPIFFLSNLHQVSDKQS